MPNVSPQGRVALEDQLPPDRLRKRSESEGDDLIGPPLGFDDVGHAANDADLHPLLQPIIIETGVANDQMNPFGFQRLEVRDNGRAGGDQFDSLGVKANSRREGVAIIQQFEVGLEQFVLQRFIRLAHAVVCDQNNGSGFRLVVSHASISLT